jgi:hypothetical protein
MTPATPALSDRLDDDRAELVSCQRAVLEPIVRAIEATSVRDSGLDATPLAYEGKALALGLLPQVA